MLKHVALMPPVEGLQQISALLKLLGIKRYPCQTKLALTMRSKIRGSQLRNAARVLCAFFKRYARNKVQKVVFIDELIFLTETFVKCIWHYADLNLSRQTVF